VEAGREDRNTKTLLRSFDAWNSHDFEALAPQISPDFYEWDMTHLEGWPEEPVYRGLEGLKALWDTWHEPWEEFQVEPAELLAKDDKVFCHVRMITRGQGSGVAVGLEYGQVTTFDDSGKIKKNQVFSSIRQARSSAGLEA
jgi:hypothetical protein